MSAQAAALARAVAGREALASALYTGTLHHLRHAPGRHAFTYRVTMLYVDLDELPSLLERAGPLRPGRFGLLSFHRHDYLPASAAVRPGLAGLTEAARDEVEAQLGTRPAGPVRLLTYPRWLGHVFNPVSFYYLFAPGGERLEAVLAEVSNTPWKERHAYALLASDQGVSASFAKRFHVSPFFPMEQRYAWRLSPPGPLLRVEMRNLEPGPSGGTEAFRVSLSLERRAFSAGQLWRAALSFPAMSAKAVLAIYWQALRLWMRKTPAFEHPATRARRDESAGARRSAG